MGPPRKKSGLEIDEPRRGGALQLDGEDAGALPEQGTSRAPGHSAWGVPSNEQWREWLAARVTTGAFIDLQPGLSAMELSARVAKLETYVTGLRGKGRAGTNELLNRIDTDPLAGERWNRLREAREAADPLAVVTDFHRADERESHQRGLFEHVWGMVERDAELSPDERRQARKYAYERDLVEADIEAAVEEARRRLEAAGGTLRVIEEAEEALEHWRTFRDVADLETWVSLRTTTAQRMELADDLASLTRAQVVAVIQAMEAWLAKESQKGRGGSELARRIHSEPANWRWAKLLELKQAEDPAAALRALDAEELVERRRYRIRKQGWVAVEVDALLNGYEHWRLLRDALAQGLTEADVQVAIESCRQRLLADGMRTLRVEPPRDPEDQGERRRRDLVALAWDAVMNDAHLDAAEHAMLLRYAESLGLTEADVQAAIDQCRVWLLKDPQWLQAHGPRHLKEELPENLDASAQAADPVEGRLAAYQATNQEDVWYHGEEPAAVDPDAVQRQRWSGRLRAVGGAAVVVVALILLVVMLVPSEPETNESSAEGGTEARGPIACAARAGDCDGDPANGCETDLSTSLAHCGRCGVGCTSTSHATGSCADGVCSNACQGGFADCNGDPKDGCEAQLWRNTEHCGTCGNRCPPGVEGTVNACPAGRCEVACAPSLLDCDGSSSNGCEIRGATDLQNCGTCGHICAAGGPHTVAACLDGSCAAQCVRGHHDVDGDPANGCEFACTVRSEDDPPDGRFRDDNCDGVDGVAADSVFVALTGDDGGDGTRSGPLRTIHAAVQLASRLGRRHVLVGAGTFTESVTLVDGISIHGSYDATASWRRNRRGRGDTIIEASRPADGALCAVSGAQLRHETLLDHLTLRTQDAPASLPGISTYGVRCIDCPGLRIHEAEVVSGNASAGAAGAQGAPSQGPGGIGSAGGPGACDDDGPGGAAGGGGQSPCGPAGGRGGRGGPSGENGGASGAQVAAGGAAGGRGGGEGDPGGRGEDGRSGAQGTPGAPGTGGNIGSSGWASAAGGPGGPGQHGTSGGGGGGGGGQGGFFSSDGYGNGGGGGGGGGCAGHEGGGGGGGGGAFGLFLVRSAGAVVSSSTVRAGHGGNGGAGGGGSPGARGGPGGEGGRVCVGEVGAGGDGGAGGNGGDGGVGGHGGGGPAVAVFTSEGAIELRNVRTVDGEPGGVPGHVRGPEPAGGRRARTRGRARAPRPAP